MTATSQTEELVVEWQASGRTRTTLWRQARPLPLGHPARWVLKRHPSGGVIAVANQRNSPHTIAIPLSAIQAKTPVSLGQWSVRIRRPFRPPPPYAPHPETENHSAREWVLYSGIKSHCLKVTRVGSRCQVGMERQSLFTYEYCFPGHTITPHVADLVWQTASGQCQALSPHVSFSLPSRDFLTGRILWKDHWWCFRASAHGDLEEIPSGLNSNRSTHARPLWAWNLGALSIVGLFVGLTFLLVPTRPTPVQKPESGSPATAPAQAPASQAPTDTPRLNIPKKFIPETKLVETLPFSEEAPAPSNEVEIVEEENLSFPPTRRSVRTGRLERLTLAGPGRLDRAEVDRTLTRHLDDIDTCYHQSPTQRASSSDLVELFWTIGPGGDATSVRVTSATPLHATVQSCLRAEIERTVFPRPRRGPVEVTWPITFSPR